MPEELYYETCATPQKRMNSFARMNIILNVPLIVLKILTIIFILTHGRWGLGDGIFDSALEKPDENQNPDSVFPSRMVENNLKLHRILVSVNGDSYYVRLFYEMFWLTSLFTDLFGSVLLLRWSKQRNVSALGFWLMLTCVLIAACFPLGLHSIFYNGFPETDVVLFLSTWAWDLFGIYCVYTARRAFKLSMQEKGNMQSVIA